MIIFLFKPTINLLSKVAIFAEINDACVKYLLKAL